MNLDTLKKGQEIVIEQNNLSSLYSHVDELKPEMITLFVGKNTNLSNKISEEFDIFKSRAKEIIRQRQIELEKKLFDL